MVLEEVLTHKKNSLLCESNNIKSWKSALNEIIKNKTLSERISKQAKIDLENNYTWKSRAAKIFEIILK